MQQFIASASIFQAYQHADIFGKLIFIALFALSVISWAVLMYKSWQMKTSKRLAKGFHQKCKSSQESFFGYDKGSLEAVEGVSNAFLAIYQTVKTQSLDLLKKNRAHLEGQLSKVQENQAYLSSADVEFIDTQLQTTLLLEKHKLEKNLFILSTIVSLAPFLGLLGTVWGILVTFADLQGGMGGSSGVILSGLSMALATTVLGLVIAIPALIAYNYLRMTLKDFEAEMENFSNEMLASIEMLYRKVDVHL